MIFAAARELVLRKGFAELSIRKLADEIGYAPGTIYLYFKSRDEMSRSGSIGSSTEQLRCMYLK
jgi:AcrR family transcriptional regulator